MAGDDFDVVVGGLGREDLFFMRPSFGCFTLE
jgi:hypothetical protein